MFVCDFLLLPDKFAGFQKQLRTTRLEFLVSTVLAVEQLTDRSHLRSVRLPVLHPEAVRSSGHRLLCVAQEDEPNHLPAPLPPLDDVSDVILLRQELRHWTRGPDADHQHVCAHHYVCLLPRHLPAAETKAVHVVEEAHYTSATGES